MLKKTIDYVNPFTDEPMTEVHYFHISKADLVEMEMEEHNQSYEKDGRTLTGMEAKLQRIIDSDDGKAIMVEFKEIIRRSYGVKDGNRFLKSREIWENFASTEAFSQLLFDLCTNAEASAEFINGIIPGNLEQIAAEIRAQAERDEKQKDDKADEIVTAVIDPTGLTNGVTPQVLTQGQLLDMDPEELKTGLASGKYKFA